MKNYFKKIFLKFQPTVTLNLLSLNNFCNTFIIHGKYFRLFVKTNYQNRFYISQISDKFIHLIKYYVYNYDFVVTTFHSCFESFQLTVDVGERSWNFKLRALCNKREWICLVLLSISKDIPSSSYFTLLVYFSVYLQWAQVHTFQPIDWNRNYYIIKYTGEKKNGLIC